LFASIAAAQSPVAPTGTLRAVYLANNPAQAVRDSATGAVRGVAVDLARELGRRLGVPVTISGVQGPQNVIDAVRSGEADIGFVAYNPERAGPVEFSETYMLVQQTFVVSDRSSIRSVKEIDRPNQTIGAGRGDSIALYLARTLKQAQLVDTTEAIAEALSRVRAGTLDAFGANRQRLTDALKTADGLRLLPDDLYGVEQSIVVPNGKPESLRAVNEFIDDVRRSGFLASAVSRSGVIGIAVAQPQGVRK
jgi:polar amino acid transport system substrate-binding protein